jgi:aminocarboxymuconate-semialdehyde decarboxylase
MKIDMYSHIMPPKYLNAFRSKVSSGFPLQEIIDATPALWDLDHRFRIMDKYSDIAQVLTFAVPPVDVISDPHDAAELAQMGNDELAEIVAKNPDRFVAGVAGLAMNNIDAALKETDRAISDLGLKGVLVCTNVNGKPLDLPEFMPLYEMMANYRLPIWIHPRRDETVADYSTESKSKYRIHGAFGWPYETEVAMARLVCSGVLEKYPGLKFITHHCGGGVPFFAERIREWTRPRGNLEGDTYLEGLSKAPIEYFRMFYADTAVDGFTPALMCGYAFFGPEHILFGTDMPFGGEQGARSVEETFRAIEEMAITDSEKKMIFEDNAMKLLQL